jgi:formylglycine-generating enzyme required for sulfatase activity
LVTWKDTPASLAERLRAKDRRWRVALATESEWEKAARGVDGRIYSWGVGTVTPDKANYRDSGVGGTSPVGCFPDGAGPGGVQEMAGNVWEWTRSLWGTNPANPDFAYPYRADDGREHENASDDELRVVRGGSFLNARVHLRAACRGRCEPRKRAFDVGFRVVVSPLSMS